jgi:hypothetical protein
MEAYEFASYGSTVVTIPRFLVHYIFLSYLVVRLRFELWTKPRLGLNQTANLANSNLAEEAEANYIIWAPAG